MPDILGQIDTVLADLDAGPDAARSIPADPTKVRALLFSHDPGATPEIVMLERDENGSVLKALQRLVGGYIDIASPAPGLDLVLHDEGLFVHPFNALATYTARAAARYAASQAPDSEREEAQEFAEVWCANIRLHGPIVAVGEVDGETVDVPAEFVAFVHQELIASGDMAM